MNIQGWMSQSELMWLQTMSKSMPSNSLIVEVGTWKGRSTAAICNALNKKSTFVTIDTWLGNSNLFIYQNSSASLVTDIFLEFLDNMKLLGHNFKWYKKNTFGLFYLRMKSVEAAKLFDDKSIDWLFLDGNHTEADKDCDAWGVKIKSGGVISGHDFTNDFIKLTTDVKQRYPNLSVATNTGIWYSTI